MTQYKLLIIRMYRHFSGKVWLNYDQAFREHAAATKLINWSCMNVQLFNFHAAGSSTRGPSYVHSAKVTEPTGSLLTNALLKILEQGKVHGSCKPLPLRTSL